MLKILRSFVFAFRGIALVLRSQRNAWIHAVASIAVIGLGLYLQLEYHHWCMIAFAIGLVWMAEAFNTSIEKLSDAITTEEHPLIRDTKDLAAGGVLIAALTAAVIGTLVVIDVLVR